MHILHDILGDDICVFIAPIQSIQIPECEIQSGYGTYIVIQCTIGWTKHRRIRITCRKYGVLYVINFITYLSFAHRITFACSRSAWSGPRMISHLKAAFIHIANDIRVIHTGRVVLHILTQHKEGGTSVVFLKFLHDDLCILPMRTVVKGEGNHFLVGIHLLLCRNDRVF